MEYCFQAIKSEMLSKMKDFEKDKLAEKCKTQGSETLNELIRKIKQNQITNR